MIEVSLKEKIVINSMESDIKYLRVSDLLAWAKQEYADALEFYEKSNPDRITQGKVMALGKLIKELEGD